MKAWSPGGTRTQLYGARLTTRGHCLPGRAQDPGTRQPPRGCVCGGGGSAPRCYRLCSGGALGALRTALDLIKTGIRTGVTEALGPAGPGCSGLEKQLCGSSVCSPFPSFCLN